MKKPKEEKKGGPVRGRKKKKSPGPRRLEKNLIVWFHVTYALSILNLIRN